MIHFVSVCVVVSHLIFARKHSNFMIHCETVCVGGGSGSNHNYTLFIVHYNLYLHNDVIDWDVDEFHKESDKPHHCKPDGSRKSNALKLCV